MELVAHVIDQISSASVAKVARESMAAPTIAHAEETEGSSEDVRSLPYGESYIDGDTTCKRPEPKTDDHPLRHKRIQQTLANAPVSGG